VGALPPASEKPGQTARVPCRGASAKKGAKKAANCLAPSNARAFVALLTCCCGWLPGVHPRIDDFILQVGRFVKNFGATREAKAWEAKLSAFSNQLSAKTRTYQIGSIKIDLLEYYNQLSLLQNRFFCHPEQSEGSQLIENARFFASLRMTRVVKRFLQEPQLLCLIKLTAES
jgi:hypothetical protein